MTAAEVQEALEPRPNSAAEHVQGSSPKETAKSEYAFKEVTRHDPAAPLHGRDSVQTPTAPLPGNEKAAKETDARAEAASEPGRPAEGQEGGLKRSFAKLGGSDVRTGQSSSRRAIHSATEAPDKPSSISTVPSDGPLSPLARTERTSADDSDSPPAGLPTGASNGRKRDASSASWSLSLSVPHKQRVQEAEEGQARLSLTLPEESERLRLMQKSQALPCGEGKRGYVLVAATDKPSLDSPTCMLRGAKQARPPQEAPVHLQLSDRQTLHLQASSTAPAQPVDTASGSQPQGRPAPQPAGFPKASSPDLPEPPHKKGSGQPHASRPAAAPGSPLRRKQQPGKGGGEEASGSEPGSPETGGDLLDAASQRILERLVLEDERGGEPRPPPPGDLAQQIKLARLLGTRGKVQAALEIAQRLRAQHAGDPDVLCLEGDCFAALGRRAQAFISLTAALRAEEDHLDGLLSRGKLLRDCLLLEEAAETLRRARAAHPGRADVAASLAAVLDEHGTQQKAAGRAEEAIALYREATATCPADAAAFYNLGVLYGEMGKAEEALEMYAAAVQREPAHARAHSNMGVLHKGAGRLEEAVRAYRRALAAAPGLDKVRANLGIALAEQAARAREASDFDEGVRLYEEALAMHPRHAAGLCGLASLYGELRQPARAEALAEMAVLAAPECWEAHVQLGVTRRELGRVDAALEAFWAALRVWPTCPPALVAVAGILTLQGQVQQAHDVLMAAVSASSNAADAYNGLGVLQREVGLVTEAIAAYDRALELQAEARTAGQNRLLALNYVHPGEGELVCREHAAWGAAFQARFTQLPARELGSEDPERRLTVAYISPDFFTHSVSYFAEAPLRHHDPARVALLAYNCSAVSDGKTARLRAAVEARGGAWADVSHLGEKALAERVRGDGVDLLVELTGHTANNRLGVLAQRPAPLQATWIGYPNSTGLEAVDFRFSDAVADPPGTRQTFAEELVRLPGCFLCYTPPADAPPVAPLPAAALGCVTFGSFNALAKITPEVVRLWARLLAAVPGSRLLLKNRPFACEQARQHFLRQMELEGISGVRVDLLPLTPGNREHLEMYAHMDISLDPWPYAGTTTTCESLYMGVPVVSLAGRCHAHNVGASLLTCIGIQDGWLAHSEEEYVAHAVAAAHDLPKLAELRAGLRERMLASRLCDGPGFVRDLEDVYRQLWKRRVGEAAPKEQTAPPKKTSEVP